MFVKFSLHHKWNDARLLFIKMEYPQHYFHHHHDHRATPISAPHPPHPQATITTDIIKAQCELAIRPTK